MIIISKKSNKSYNLSNICVFLHIPIEVAHFAQNMQGILLVVCFME